LKENTVAAVRGPDFSSGIFGVLRRWSARHG
jgi:hypothetical protein